MTFSTARNCARIPATRAVTGVSKGFAVITAALAVLLLSGCAGKPSNNVMIADGRAAVVRFVDRDPGLQDWVNHAHGYAVFPSVNKGGFGVGGSYGRGVVFERGEPVGTTSSVQGTVGLQIGVQNFSQIIFFQDDAALRTFQRGNFEFSAQATAVAATAGAAKTTSYEKGVAVFIMAKSGLMAEASVGGQKFTYEPL